jgi:phenylacetate-CoA ligase
MAFEDLLNPLAGLNVPAPSWLRTTAERASSWLPERLRRGNARARFREELDGTRGSAAAARLSRAKLQATLTWALETVPAYQRYRPLLARCSDPARLLSKLPITDKADIRRNPEFYASRGVPESQRLRCVSGRGHPLGMCLDRLVAHAREQAYIDELRARVGARPGSPVLSLRSSGQGMPQASAALARSQPELIEAFCSTLLPLARSLEANPMPGLLRSLKGVMLYGENVPQRHLELFRAVFGCPVIKHYGQSERVLMAASMPDDDRYFFWPQYGWFELVDFDDRPIVRPGVVGHIVGTGFDNRVMPFVRYRTGDLGVLGATSHPELAGYPVCESIEGRAQEFLVDGRGNLVSLSSAHACLDAGRCPWLEHVTSLQYRQERAGELVLRFVAGDAFRPEMQQRMGEAIAAATGCKVRLARVLGIERDPGGRERLLVQKLDIARRLEKSQ